MKLLKNCELLEKKGMTYKSIIKILKTKSPRNINYWLERAYCIDDAKINSKIKTPGTYEYFRYFKNNSHDLALELSNKYKLLKANTLDNFIKKYGIVDGSERWKVYCNKQAAKNSFDEKHKKFGWTLDEYDIFNKSRAVTLDNFIKKYGIVDGNERWKVYCDRQSYTKSKKYFIEKFGIDKGTIEWDRINKLKCHSYESYLHRYDGNIEIATEKFNEFIKNRKFNIKSCSKVADEMFDKLKDFLLKSNFKEFYFHGHNQEWGFNINNYGYVYLDFYLKDTGKVIEFYGDYWHANPANYKSTQYLKINGEQKLVSDIWKADEIRINYIKRIPYIKDVLIIWQLDYINDEDVTLNKCKNYLIN